MRKLIAMQSPIETFSALEGLGCAHGFTRRVPGLDVKVERELALQRLDDAHVAARHALGLGDKHFVTARQVHGREVAIVDKETRDCFEGVDGLMTSSTGVCLGIYVADCGPVYLVEPERRVIALLHSGRKGSELGIAAVAVRKMREAFGCDPGRIVAQLGPCIRPPHYEVDFAAQILAQCREAGVRQVHDCGTCTACHLDRYYSYRLEMGKTGRMLALLALKA
jgi:copper oxidase (laccase) domain-containing protein